MAPILPYVSHVFPPKQYVCHSTAVYVPMPHPNSIAAVLHMVYLVTKNLPQIKNYFVSNQELQKYEKLSNMENSE